MAGIGEYIAEIRRLDFEMGMVGKPGYGTSFSFL